LIRCESDIILGGFTVAISTINPATGEELKTFDALSEEGIDGKLQLAADTFREYRKTTFAERSGWLTRAAEILEEEAEELGRIMTLEMGKTLASAIGEANKCVRGCRYYAENAEGMLADEQIELEGARTFVRYQPIGPGTWGCSSTPPTCRSAPSR
jgi:succinate-semialdehyde dehydrogenase/glutarate-semialdehyde dehydrogenase